MRASMKSAFSCVTMGLLIWFTPAEGAGPGDFLQHVSSGLFLHAAYGFEDSNSTILNNGRTAQNGQHGYLKAGLRLTWTPYGATIFYGDYAEYLDQLGPAALALGATECTLARFGGGGAQEIDAAAMTVYLKYQHYEAEISGAALAPAVTGPGGADLISAGGVIQF